MEARMCFEFYLWVELADISIQLFNGSAGKRLTYFSQGIGKEKVLYCPRAIEHFGLSQYRGKNCLIYCLHSHQITVLLPNYNFFRQIKKTTYLFQNKHEDS
jgi:hypothetical protein